jgi:hypothetical protein
MRHIALAILAASATSCTYPEKELVPGNIDGPPFGCLNQPLPTQVKPQVKISGNVVDPFAGSIPVGATIQAFLVGNPAPVFSTTIDAMGKFSYDQGTGGFPHEFYLKIAPNGYVTTYYYPSIPLVDDLTATIFVFTPQDLPIIGGLAQLNFDTTKTVFSLNVIDCNGKPVGGATVSSSPAGEIRYFTNSAPNPTAIATDTMTGLVLIANVPFGNTTISAMVNGMNLRSHSMDTQPGVVVQSAIQP